ncbi:Polyubiquitin 3 [Camellia lanceoleosa]|uniref:Polyubiquitin 3 n=1 Tax=Camellia lanceoleosa TaxID=1840588 RepID=A0ACC0HB01_9ERIC|nr:Polyubiquitin 3 [Camellia lanceoleosa]
MVIHCVIMISSRGLPFTWSSMVQWCFKYSLRCLQVAKQLHFQLNMSDTVLNIKNVIEVEERIRQDLHILYYGAKQLNDTQKLVDLDIPKNSTFQLFVKPTEELQIFVNVARKTIPLEVKGWHTVRDIKAMIQSVEQILIHARKRLVNSHTLAKYDLKMDPIIHLVCPLMDIFIRIRPIGKMVSLKVKKWDLVANGKALISEKKGIPLQQQTLTHDGEPLKDEDTLSACGIGEKSTLDMDLCPRSAMQVYICKKNQEFVPLEVRAWYAVIDVKNLIQGTEGRLHDHLELVYKAVPLKDSKTLADCGIKEKSTLFMIFIKTRERTVVVDVEKFDTIDSVMNKVRKKLSFTTDCLRLMFIGKSLQGHQTLADYGIQNCNTLELAMAF